MRWRRAAAALCLATMSALPLAAGAAEPSPPGVVEAMRIATEAYIYGYPLVTFDMARKQQTNVATPDAEHAPMGQMIRMRTYPAVDNHCCAAPNADTLYTEAWLDVSTEPWVLSIPDMGNRYYIVPMLDGWSEVFSWTPPPVTRVPWRFTANAVAMAAMLCVTAAPTRRSERRRNMSDARREPWKPGRRSSGR